MSDKVEITVTEFEEYQKLKKWKARKDKVKRDYMRGYMQRYRAGLKLAASA